MKYVGIDLAWNGDRNPSAIAVGHLVKKELILEEIKPNIKGLKSIVDFIKKQENLLGIAVDASLKIPNKTGYRTCETELNKVYRTKWAGTYPTNQKLYPDAFSVKLSHQLEQLGFEYGYGKKWQLECYPHASVIEIFGLKKRLSYKKGNVESKKSGQKELATYLHSLSKNKHLKLIIPSNLDRFFNSESIDNLKGAALKSNEDALDAVVCLYTATLYAIGQEGTSYGNDHEGFVWVPDFK